MSPWSEPGTWGKTGSLTDAWGARSAMTRLNIGRGRGLELLLEDSEIVEKSTGGGGGRGGKDEIVDLAEKSAPTEEMCEVFSAEIDVKVFMLESAPSGRREEVVLSVEAQLRVPTLSWSSSSWSSSSLSSIIQSFSPSAIMTVDGGGERDRVYDKLLYNQSACTATALGVSRHILSLSARPFTSHP